MGAASEPRILDTTDKPHRARWPWLRIVILLSLAVVLVAGFGIWSLSATRLDVRVTVQPYSFPSYDDLAGHRPLGTIVQITNFSQSDAWYLGWPGGPTVDLQQLILGKWESHTSWSFDPTNPRRRSDSGRRCARMESVTILAGPVSEKANELRVGVPFTTELAPSEAHWIISPAVKIVKQRQEYLPEAKPGAEQEEKIASLNQPYPLPRFVELAKRVFLGK